MLVKNNVELMVISTPCRHIPPVQGFSFRPPLSSSLGFQWIRLFDFYSGKCLAKVAGHSELATGVRFTSDGRRLVTIGGERSLAQESFIRQRRFLSQGEMG